MMAIQTGVKPRNVLGMRCTITECVGATPWLFWSASASQPSGRRDLVFPNGEKDHAQRRADNKFIDADVENVIIET
ncbi:unnamed protein product, partial [Brenthis ino]